MVYVLLPLFGVDGKVIEGVGSTIIPAKDQVFCVKSVMPKSSSKLIHGVKHLLPGI